MILIACGMNRSGSTLHFQILKRLVQNVGGETIVDPDVQSLEKKLRKSMKLGVSPIVIKSHSCTPFIESLLTSGEAVGFYTYRDPRDSAASLARMHKWGFQQLYVSRVLYDLEPNYNDFKRFFGSSVDKRNYRDFHSSIAQECLLIASRLGLDLGEGQAADIERDLLPGKQKERISRLVSGVQDNIPFYNYKVDPNEQLLDCHITSDGQSTWKEFFSPVEQYLITERLRTLIDDLGFQASLPELSGFDLVRLMINRARLRKELKSFKNQWV